jgi:MFS family permease
MFAAVRFRLPDVLATRTGRLATFFFLYVTEGIPLGFTAIAVATQMRRQGLGPAAIGAFVAALYLPWAFKWAMGPIVDTVTSRRFGRRRTWIVGAQTAMALVLLAATPVDYVTQLALFTVLVLAVNACGAAMDVAIDALAVDTLPADERGVANGVMFGGAYLGQAIGGSAVLFLSDVVPFRSTYFFVAGMILLVTVFVALPIRERAADGAGLPGGLRLRAVLEQIGAFVAEAFRSFVGSRGALVGVVFALLPAGAYALGLALQSNLAVELGLDDGEIATLNLYTTILSAAGCIAGGFVSDRIGRRKSLAVFAAATILPTLWLAWAMQQAGWIHAIPLDEPNRPTPAAALVAVFWWASIAFGAIQGLGYGVRTALFTDVTNPKVAATQFTAYMALMNLAISYSAAWQGRSIEAWGYPVTLALDAALGLVSLALLPLMTPRRQR